MTPSLAFLLLTVPVAQPPEKKPDEPKTATKPHPLASLRLRSIGPGLMSGRVVGFAVEPDDRSHYYVAVASGGVWKTTNAGVTWTPVFDPLESGRMSRTPPIPVPGCDFLCVLLFP